MNARDLKRSLGVLVALPLSLLVTWTPSAHAHAAYEASDPANGATVSSPPTSVVADFTEPVIDGSELEVYDPCGVQVDNGDSFVTADRITVSMSADKQGTYRVLFSVVSYVDGHPTNGEFTFSSSGGSKCPASAPEEEGKDPGPDAGSTGSGSQESTGDAATSEGNTGDRAGGGSAKQRTAKESRKEGSGTRQRADRSGPPAAADPTEVLAAEQSSRRNEDIPLPGLLLSLVLAGVIGALGGRIYLESGPRT